MYGSSNAKNTKSEMKFGPAGEAPSRFQRTLCASDPKVSSGVFGGVLSAFIVLLAVVRRSGQDDPLFYLSIFLFGWLGSSTGFHLLRSDRNSTKDERLRTEVAYLPAMSGFVTSRTALVIALMVLFATVVELVVVFCWSILFGVSGWLLVNILIDLLLAATIGYNVLQWRASRSEP